VILFPDISEFQNQTPNKADLRAIRELTPAIILRVAYGQYHLDQAFMQWREEVHALDFKLIGLYHYLVVGQDSGSQASQYCTWLQKLEPNEIPILDLEEGNGSQSARAVTWFNVVDPYFGLDKLPLNNRSWLYSYTDFVNNHGLRGIFNSDRHTWLASYRDTEPNEPLHTLWQSSDGRVGANTMKWPGIPAECDTNQYNGTIEQLVAATFPHKAPPVTTGGPKVWNIHATDVESARLTIAWDHSGGVNEWQVHLEGPGFDRTANTFVPVAVYEGLRPKSTYRFSVRSIVDGHGAGVVGKDTFTTN
jgi:GH25 family lysozyme M1 (1,4-beta-N-acetylmuramidase)